MLKFFRFFKIKSQKTLTGRFFYKVFAKFSGLVGIALMNLVEKVYENKVFITNLGNAWFISSLLLLLFKIFFFSFPFQINILLLLILTFFSYIYFWYFFFKHLFIVFLRKIMPKSIQQYRDCVWEDLILEAEDFPKKKAEFEKKSKVSFLENLFLNIYIFLIFLRMFLIQKFIIYFFCYLVIFFSLIATNNFFFLNVFSLIVLLSKLCFFLSCDTVSEYKICMHCFSKKDLPYQIETTKKNAIIFSYINLSLLYKPNYVIFLLKNELDIPFIFILIVQHFINLGFTKETAMKCEIDIKK